MAAALGRLGIQGARRGRSDGRQSLRQCQADPQTPDDAASGEPSHQDNRRTSSQEANGQAAAEASSHQALIAQAAWCRPLTSAALKLGVS